MYFDWAQRWTNYRAKEIAFKDADTQQTLTFEQLDHLGGQLGARFVENYQLAKGSRIAIIAENGLPYPLLFVAAQKFGFTLVPINYRLSSSEIDFILNDADPTVVIIEAAFLDTFANTSFSGSETPVLSFEHVINYAQEGTESDQVLPLLTDTDPIFILYTSGTTGFPKGALYTHKMLFWNSINTALSLTVNTESRTLNVMPPFHTGGWNVLTTPFFHHGGYSCLLRKFDAVKVLELLQKERVTIFMAVPTMLKMIADCATFESANLSELLYIIVGGEPLPVPLIERWHTKGVPIRQGYGMTEAGPNLTSLHHHDAILKKGAIGKPNFYVEAKIVNPKNENCPPNVPGELLLRGPMVTPGYWRNEKATAQAFHGEWFRSGDTVVTDSEGFLYVVGRIKEMYISGGENIYPAEIERCLEQHPSVAEVAVIGIADAKWGEVGKACIVPTRPITAQTLIAYCKANLASYKVPKQFVFLESLPKNGTGKIDKQQLKTLHS